MSIQQDRLALEEEKQRVKEQAAFYKLFKSHPEWACQANESVLRAYFNSEEITFPALLESAERLAGQGRLAILSADKVTENREQEQKQAAAKAVRDRLDLEATLLGEIDNPGQREYVRRAIKFEAPEKVQQRLDDLRLKRSLIAMEPDEIRAYLKNQRGTAPAPVIEKITLSKQEILNLGPREYRALLYDQRGIEKPGVRIQIENIMKDYSRKGEEHL